MGRPSHAGSLDITQVSHRGLHFKFNYTQVLTIFIIYFFFTISFFIDMYFIFILFFIILLQTICAIKIYAIII